VYEEIELAMVNVNVIHLFENCLCRSFSSYFDTADLRSFASTVIVCRRKGWLCDNMRVSSLQTRPVLTCLRFFP